ncbi:ferritin-like domain-containing protein [Telmatospirillum sp. J64-1]|uniref:YciE/YciF ferroxidase family protein n=1 Tax=Telmatospirillum sp. J64-1 TaxID=2502183 RepID=UPI00115DA846|nr:DUF892 family protein [Telmatospirillum sp. J64-1]
MNINSAQDLLMLELREIYSAEKQLSRALPRLTKSVHTDKVKECLQERVEQSRRLLEDVDQVFEELNLSKGRQKNLAMEGLIEDAQQLAESIKSTEVMDTALIAAVQKLEHYCIAAWGTAAALSRSLGHDSAEKVFQKALQEGKNFDKMMTDLAVNEVNPTMVEKTAH